jgi:hypothetical protein
MPQYPVGASFFTVVKSWFRKWIVTLALWSWLPLRLAKWVLQHHEDRD